MKISYKTVNALEFIAGIYENISVAFVLLNFVIE